MQHLIIEDTIFNSMEGKSIAAELIRAMLALLPTALQPDEDPSTYTDLLVQILSVIATGRLPKEAIVKLMHRCNYHLFNLA